MAAAAPSQAYATAGGAPAAGIAQTEAEHGPVNIGGVRYAGFGSRFVAGIVDTVLCSVLLLLPMLTLTESPLVTLMARVLVMLLSYGYFILATAIWGQTLGKRAARIRVERLDGGATTLGQSVMRVAVYFACAVLTLFAALVAYTSLPPDVLAQTPQLVRIAIRANTPAWNELVGFVSLGFCIADVIVFLVSSKHRALHDLMAGTVVVHTD
jgi:uncharacterized RDD family membrane protein YckC